MSLPHSIPARPTGAPPSSPLGEDRVSLLRIASTVMRHRGLVVGLALLCFALVVLRALIVPRTYSTRSSFVAQSDNAPLNLSGIAAQFGLSLPGGGEAGRSPAFYADLVTSRQILGGLVDTRFSLGPDRRQVTLPEFYESSGKTPALRREEAIRTLRGELSVTVDQPTGTVKVRATAEHPQLALLLNRRLLELLNEFNLNTRQSQAGMERRFTEKRLEEVRRELREAEDRQQVFLQRNRDYRNSPELSFQQDRLKREVDMRQQLYAVLAESYERSKIDEVRDTPVITVVERPELPVRPDPRGLIKWGLVALIAGAVIGALIGFGRDALDRSRIGEPAEFAEFAELKRQSTQDLLHPWRPLQRWIRGPARR